MNQVTEIEPGPNSMIGFRFPNIQGDTRSHSPLMVEYSVSHYIGNFIPLFCYIILMVQFFYSRLIILVRNVQIG